MTKQKPSDLVLQGLEVEVEKGSVTEFDPGEEVREEKSEETKPVFVGALKT